MLAQNENRLVQQFGVRHQLNIHRAERGDFGNYSCRAENDLGKAKAFIEVSGEFPAALQLHTVLVRRRCALYLAAISSSTKWLASTSSTLSSYETLFAKCLLVQSYWLTFSSNLAAIAAFGTAALMPILAIYYRLINLLPKPSEKPHSALHC